MKRLIIYPNCVLLTGEKASYLSHDKKSNPTYKTCTDCKHMQRCMEQFHRFHEEEVKEIEVEAEPKYEYNSKGLLHIKRKK